MILRLLFPLAILLVVNCFPSFSPVLAADLTIASVEVVTPAQRTITPAAQKAVRVASAKPGGTRMP
jgi:hypothetical protein